VSAFYLVPKTPYAPQLKEEEALREEQINRLNRKVRELTMDLDIWSTRANRYVEAEEGMFRLGRGSRPRGGCARDLSYSSTVTATVPLVCPLTHRTTLTASAVSFHGRGTQWLPTAITQQCLSESRLTRTASPIRQ
jgi:hypothetical protein